MPLPQSALLPLTGRFGLFATFSLAPGADCDAVRRAAAELPRLTARLAAETGEPALVSAVGFAAGCWIRLLGQPVPADLAPFPAMGEGLRRAPATAGDLFLHLHSDRHDANFELARAWRDLLGRNGALVEEVHGFRHREGRDLNGFVDGTENPQGEERAEVALVGAEDDAFAGGSYVAVQRWVHDMAAWSRLRTAEQEAVIGRTKADDIELEDKAPTSHVARVVIEENGEELEILRHSMPYGTTAEAGLQFIAYGRSPAPFAKMLARMVGADGDGHDALMDYTRPVTGSLYFVPSLDLLGRL